jgi:LPXTG-site transpeptidase (sortase) family protein
MKKNVREKIGGIYITVGIFFCILAVALLAYPQLPYILNATSISSPEKEEENLTEPIFAQEKEEEEVIEEPTLELPEKDTDLPEENYIVIPKIGVNAVIQTGENAEEALDKGPWIVNDYADPESRYLQETSKSIIIASHRFGYSSWSDEKRTKISFFNLPNTKVGDRVTVIWNQREYVYEIVEVGETTYVEEYDTDLILYTCRYYNSPIRIFRYANLVFINGEVPETL